MKTICGDLKEADDHLVTMAQKRLSSVLQKLCHCKNFGESEDKSLNLKLSREELAGMIGTATESCIRLLSEFNKAGYIALSGKITVLNSSALRKI
jgi:CRP-like cAMP-binding protein